MIAGDSKCFFHFRRKIFEKFSGVADGVGGWIHYGIDPGEFSSFLMRTCERLVNLGKFTPTEPAGLLARSYYELLENKQPILGHLSYFLFEIV